MASFRCGNSKHRCFAASSGGPDEVSRRLIDKCPGTGRANKNEPLGRRYSMIPIKHALAGLGAVLAMTVATSAMAQKTVVGVSWSNFQEERWKTDEAAIKAASDRAGRRLHQRRCPKLAFQAARRRGKPDLPRRHRADRAGPGQQRHHAGHRQGDRRGHSGRRIRPADRSAGRLLPDLRQQGSRPHPGAPDRQGAAQGQLRLHQGKSPPIRTPISCMPDSSRC